MEEVVLFTRQRGEGAEGNEQQSLDRQVRIIEAYADQMNLQIVDRVVAAGTSAHELCNRLLTTSGIIAMCTQSSPIRRIAWPAA